MNMRHTTHHLTEEQKRKLFEKHKDLITLIHILGDMALRKQIKTLFHMLHPDVDITTIEFDIAELILTGFLLQQQIQKPSKTQMLYLSKYPRSHFYNKDKTGDVPALNFTNAKVYEQIFKIEYLMDTVIPMMQKKDFLLSTDNLIAYLYWIGSNLLVPANQYGTFDFYDQCKEVCEKHTIPFLYDFKRDYYVSLYEKVNFENRQLKQNTPLPENSSDYKLERDRERDSYTSDIEKSKYFYNFNNMHKQGFVIEDIAREQIKIAYFDSSNNIAPKKLYTNLSYVYLMFTRYFKFRDLKLDATVYVWDKEKAAHLEKEESVEAYDFYNQEMSGLSRKYKSMQDIGLLPQYWENINASYKSMDIFTKYNIRPQS